MLHNAPNVTDATRSHILYEGGYDASVPVSGTDEPALMASAVGLVIRRKRGVRRGGQKELIHYYYGAD